MLPNQSRLTLKPLFITLIVLTLLAIFIKSQLATIEPAPPSAPENIYSSERAFNMLQQLTKEQVPHPVDSVANRIVEHRLVGLLRGMGYQEDIQDTQVCLNSIKWSVRCTRVRNIIVTIEGRKPGKGILLSAHYDSVPAGPGGSDAGAAVGTLLEVARLLSISAKPLNSIVLLFNEGEEFGLMGAKAFMEQHPLAKQLQLAINVEARGSSGQSVMFETGEDSGWLVEHYAQTTPAPLSSSLFYEVYKYLPNDTDLTVFKEHGLQGLNFGHAERLAHYHTPLDNLANLDHGSLQHHGDNVWGVLNRIKDVDLNTTPKGNLVYTDVMGLFVLQWDESTSLWLSLFALLMLAPLMAYFIKQQQLDIKQGLKGILAVVVIVILSALTGLLVLLITQTISGNAAPWHTNALPMQLSLWLGVLVSGLLCAKFFANKASVMDMAFAVTSSWALLSLATSVVMPGISFLFIIPSLAGVVAFLAIVWLGRKNVRVKSKYTLQATILVILASITAILFMPVAYVLEVMVTYKMAPAIGIILGFVVSALLPLLTIKNTLAAQFRKFIVAITTVMFAGIAWTSWQPAFSEWMPQRINLQYVQNQKNEAFILAGDYKNQISQELASALPGETQLRAIFPWLKRRYHAVVTPSVRLQTAELAILQSTPTKSGKQVSVRLSIDQRNLSDVKVYIPADASLMSIDVSNENINYRGKKANHNGFYQYHCRGLSCAQSTLTLIFSKTKSVNIFVAAVYAGLPQEHNTLIEHRGSTAVASQNGDQSVIFTEFEL